MEDKKEIEKDAKKEYEQLLSSGYMFEFFPELTGEYKKDKQLWIRMYKKLKRLRNDKDIDNT